MKRASIIISVDNSFAIIDNFFQTLYSFINKEIYEIIVVDDYCTDFQTIQYLKILKEKSLIDILITLDKKCGFGKANNIGVKNSTTNCLIFMNTDIIINNDIIDKLVDIYYEKKWGCFQPLLLYPQNQKIQSAGHLFGTFFNRHALENNTPDILNDQLSIKRQALTLAFCVIDKKIFWEAGGFNEFYYNGYEGIETILKINQKHICVLIPYLTAYHVRSVAVSKTVFDEEQKIPYFWCRCNDMIKNDFVTFIQQFLPETAYAKHYMALQMTSFDLVTEVTKAGIHISESISLIQNGPIELFSLLPFSFLHTPTPLLFLCDNFTQLKNNLLWIQLRKGPYDLIVDSNGNVKILDSLL
jgi:GT2 family glycosyltransferase